MMTPAIDCEQFGDLLADLLERDVDESTRARLESHALSCGDCGPLLADLRKLRIDAAALPALEPPRDLWSGIAARIETPVVELSPGGRVTGEPSRPARQVSRRRLTPVWIGLAAAGLVAVTSTVTYRITKQSVEQRGPASIGSAGRVATTSAPAPTSQSAAAAAVVASQTPATQVASGPDRSSSAERTAPATASLASNKLSPEQTYDLEIKRLRAIVAQRRSTLDTATIGVIERNLKVIDDAILQCREALRKDPASRFLLESLNDALDTKIQLLRTAAMLPART